MNQEQETVNSNAAFERWAKSHPFITEEVLVSNLTIDRRVQRTGLNLPKVERMVKKFNPSSLGVVTVSRRKDKSMIVIDGQHRWEATRRVTDNEGLLLCHVFEGLELAEEAQMFLDLNDTSKPPVIDQFKVSLQADSPGGEEAREISRILLQYGWKVSATAADGNVNAVQAISKIYRLSLEKEADPNLLAMTFLVVTRAWGTNRMAGQAPMVEGIGRMFAEYGSRIDTDRLISVMKSYKGGAQSLLSETSQLARLSHSRHSMALATALVNEYNRGLRTRTLEAWRQR
jgi:hypothetical protein